MLIAARGPPTPLDPSCLTPRTVWHSWHNKRSDPRSQPRGRRRGGHNEHTGGPCLQWHIRSCRMSCFVHPGSQLSSCRTRCRRHHTLAYRSTFQFERVALLSNEIIETVGGVCPYFDSWIPRPVSSADRVNCRPLHCIGCPPQFLTKG